MSQYCVPPEPRSVQMRDGLGPSVSLAEIGVRSQPCGCAVRGRGPAPCTRHADARCVTSDVCVVCVRIYP